MTDDLTQELARVARRPWFNRGGMVLAGIVLAIAGFIGGVHVQRAYGTGGAGQAGGAGQPGAGAQAAGGQAGGQRAGGSTSGTVKLVDGTTVYLLTADGTIVTVKTTDATAILTAAKGTVKDLKAGATVTAIGPTGTDGAVTATTLTQVAK
jgi:hypothetical protein